MVGFKQFEGSVGDELESARSQLHTTKPPSHDNCNSNRTARFKHVQQPTPCPALPVTVTPPNNLSVAYVPPTYDVVRGFPALSALILKYLFDNTAFLTSSNSSMLWIRAACATNLLFLSTTTSAE